MKNIKIIFLILIVGVLSFSCKGDDDADLSGVNVNGNITLSTSISEFDTNKDMTFNLFSDSGITFDEIKVFEGSTEIATATIDNASNSAVFNSSSLGDFIFPDDEDEDGDDKTGTYPINTISKISNGNSFHNAFTIRVEKELTMDDEVASVIFADTLKTSISFKTRTSMDNLDFVKVFWKKNFNGTYAEDTDFTFDEDNKKVEFEDVVDMTTKYALAVNDTVYFKFSTQKGALTDDVVTTIGIDAQSLENSGSGTINDSSENIFNFSDDNSISYTSPYGFSVVAPSTMKFVTTTIDFDSDIFDVKTAFDSGTQVTSVTNLSQGDIIVYKTDRMVEIDDVNVSKVFYGILKVDEISLVNGTDESITFVYKEGMIIGE